MNKVKIATENFGMFDSMDDTRNYQTGTLYQLLCDRYDLGYHTPPQKLVDLVKNELEVDE